MPVRILNDVPDGDLAQVDVFRSPGDVAEPLDLLTPREREISILVAKGFSNKEVAQFLEISHWTVATHLKATYLKLGLKRRSELTYVLRRLL
ncbi:response regulator transcription factor [Sulfitobacter aestuarii]|uniref:Response regulator transcription factor n=1 Tax=Sulfitobacter aestuarii TaxID=2161676 RepID=A0ABW5U4F2_9RHOB